MDSSDGTRDDDMGQPYVPSGARRSTFTPPVASTTPVPVPVPAAAPVPAVPDVASTVSDIHDDDELAAALSAENDRIVSNTQSIPIQGAMMEGLFEPEAAAVVVPVEEPEPTPVTEPPAPVSVAAPDPEIAPPPAEDPPAEAAPITRRSLRAAPERHALADDDIVRALDAAADQPTDTLSLIEKLEAELGLREQEELEYRVWENSTLALGTPEAVQAVEEARHTLASPVAEAVDSVAVAGEPESPDEPSTPVDEPAPELMPQGEETPVHDFDAILAGEITAPAAPIDEVPFPDFDEPFVEALAPFDSATGAVRTGSIELVDQHAVEEFFDAEEDADRPLAGIGGTIAVDTSGIAVVQSASAPPSGPIATARIPDDETVVANNEPVKQPVFSLEESGLAPTPLDQRIGHASRMFWLWFAANSSVVSIGFGAVIFSLGMSLRQAIVAVLVGVALSFLPFGLGTLAGKRSGQPTMVVSRAAFGLLGNMVPSVVAVVSRLFWGAVFLWLLAVSAAAILDGGSLSASLGPAPLAFIALAIGFLIVLLIAFAGYPLLSRVQLVLSILSGILVVGFIAITAVHLDFATALRTGDGSWWLVVTGAVIVFCFVGLAWANSTSDLARYQRVGSSGASSMLWATFGATLPAFVLMGYGAILAASDPQLATDLTVNPLGAIASLLPGWYPIPLLLATALSLLSGAAVTLYSAGFAIQASGLRLSRQLSVVISGVLLLGIAVLLTVTVTGGVWEIVRDVATSVAVPVAAWAGIFASDVMIRNRRYHSRSLLRRGGVYPDVNWVNLSAFVAIIVIAFGFTSATVGWLSWQGYFFSLVGIPADGVVAGTDLGVLLALVLGLLTPIVAGVGTIRRQEDVEGRLHAQSAE